MSRRDPRTEQENARRDQPGHTLAIPQREHGPTGDTDEEPLTDEKWRAITQNDAAYDHLFFYAIRTTGIFCRPSCKSRVPKRENVRIFRNAAEALAAHFRPCKRCKPTGQRLPDVEWVAQITACIEAHFCEPITLETLAEMCHGSPYHLHRTFKRIKGITPVEYVQQLRINKAIECLIHSTKPVTEIAMMVGMTNTPYFITLFKKKTGLTPTAYRQTHRHPSDTEVLSREDTNEYNRVLDVSRP